MQKFKVGDSVTVCSERPPNRPSLHWVYDMDQHLGKTLTISSISDRGTYKLNHEPRHFHEDWLTLAQPTIEFYL